MRFSTIRAAIEIARLDQEEATFLEIFSGWINEDGNRERLVRLFDNGLSAGNPFEGVCFNREELIAFLAHDGMTKVRFGGMQEPFVTEAPDLIEQFIDWLEVNDNRSRLIKLEAQLGDWNELLINAFWGSQTDEAILNCFAACRIRQLTSRALEKIYFVEEPAE